MKRADPLLAITEFQNLRDPDEDETCILWHYDFSRFKMRIHSDRNSAVGKTVKLVEACIQGLQNWQWNWSYGKAKNSD
jgi:hypothetical protein